MTPVATSRTAWPMKTIAWHPGPRTTHTYAIASACGSVHLMDAKQHRRNRIWTHAELGGRQSRDAQGHLELTWSLDGTQLLASSDACASLMHFAFRGPQARKDTKQTQKPADRRRPRHRR